MQLNGKFFSSGKNFLAGFAAITAMVVFCSSAALAKTDGAGKAPPNIWGVWLGAGYGFPGMVKYANTPWTPKPEFTDWGLAKAKRLDDPASLKNCAPSHPYLMMSGNPLYPLEIINAGTHILIMIEPIPYPRRIYIDGRGHPDLPPAYFGHSIGHWEGQVLVIDTVNIKESDAPLNGPKNAASFELPGDKDHRLPISDQSVMRERIRLLDGGQYLENEITITDPKAYKKPITTKIYSQRRSDLDLYEYLCTENLRPDAEGYEVDMSPKP